MIASGLSISLHRLTTLALMLAVATAFAEPLPSVVRFGVSNAGVGTPPRIGTGWLAVAQTKGFIEEALKKDNIKVQWIFFKGQGPQVNEALTNEQLDFTTLGDLPSVIGRSVGIKARLIMVTSTRGNSYVAVRPDSDIKTIANLRGKRVGFHKGTATQLAVDRILEQNGLSERDIKVINLEPASSLAAFQTGDLDAIFGTLNLKVLESKGQARIIYSTRDNPAASGNGHVLVTDKFSSTYPGLTQRVVTALVRAASYASQEAHRDEVLKLWASSGGIPAAIYDEELKGIPLAHRHSPRFDDYVRAADQRSMEDAYRFKLIRKRFSVDAWIDDRYVNQAINDLGLDPAWPRFDATARIVTRN
ncbi:ABC transporter substrate-binding protein [Cupriavidus sp. PET2-C1]